MMWLTIARVIVVGLYELADEIRQEVRRERQHRAGLAPVIDLAAARAARQARR
jgi:hypothetical protein